MKKFFKLALHPNPQPEGFDTGLRFTDVLFGFVIKELFTRLLNWATLDVTVRLHLIAGTTLVLGSWIGFRNSLYRSRYQLKFFNLPLFRFLVDQLMLILYFRVAVLTPVLEVNKSPVFPDPRNLADSTTKLMMWVFLLYVIWDLLGIWIARAKANGSPRYPKIESLPAANWQEVNWAGLMISTAFFAALLLLWYVADCCGPNTLLAITIGVLLSYRFAKEIRTSW